MAGDKHNIRKGETIMFADDVERTVYPLTIRSLRKFIKVIEKLGDTEDATEMSDDQIDNMMDAAEIILEKVDKILSSDRDALEDAIDLHVFNRLMTVAMGAASPEE